MYVYKYLSVILDDTADFNQTAELWRTITSSSFSQILFFLTLTEFNITLQNMMKKYTHVSDSF